MHLAKFTWGNEFLENECINFKIRNGLIDKGISSFENYHEEKKNAIWSDFNRSKTTREKSESSF